MTAIVAYKERSGILAAQLADAQKRMLSVIPAGSGLTPNRIAGIVMDACMRAPGILECTPESIVRCAIQGAEVGLEVGSPLGEAYLVPHRNNRTGTTECTFILGYRGLTRLALQSPSIRNIESRIVRAGDEFSYRYGTDPMVAHTPHAGGRDGVPGEVTHAYAVAYFVGGGYQFDVMDRSELDAIRKRSRAERGPWVTDTIEMMKKCPVRRMAKMLDLTPLGRAALGADQEVPEINEPHVTPEFQSGRVDALKQKITVIDEKKEDPRL